jgi:hypothetical protein
MHIERASATWRRYLKVSVRGLMVIVLLAGISLGWLVGNARIQRDAVAAIERTNGGVAMYDGEYIGAPGRNALPFWKKWIADRIGVDYVGNVIFVQIVTTADDPVGQRALVSLSALGGVETLNLVGPEVTDATLEDLRPLKQVKSLMIQNCRVTNAGMSHLAALPQLETLYINGVPIRDDCVVFLSRLAGLRNLSLFRTEVTAAGTEELRRALPRAKISRQ